jgi:hypothetical protein
VSVNAQPVAITTYVAELEAELLELEKIPVSAIGDNINTRSKEIEENQRRLDSLTIQFEVLNQNLSLRKDRELQYIQQLDEVRQELRQNKDVKKIYELGGQAELSIATKNCPTCSQPVDDSLFLQEAHVTPMSVDENIRYVEAQEKMIVAYLSNEQKSISLDEGNLRGIIDRLQVLRQEIRELKTELVSNEKSPSIVEIEKRLRLRNRIERYSEALDEITGLLAEFHSLSAEWAGLLRSEKELPSGDLSAEDTRKIEEVELTFRELLRKFGYSSKAESSISVSRLRERKFLLPVAESDGFVYNLRFDSSGSDLIRSIWAYYCALLRVSIFHRSNHPRLLIFDEPIQQDVSNSSSNAFFNDLKTIKIHRFWFSQLSMSLHLPSLK